MVNFFKKSIKGIKSLLEVNTGIFFSCNKNPPFNPPQVIDSDSPLVLLLSSCSKAFCAGHIRLDQTGNHA